MPGKNWIDCFTLATNKLQTQNKKQKLSYFLKYAEIFSVHFFLIFLGINSATVHGIFTHKISMKQTIWYLWYRNIKIYKYGRQLCVCFIIQRNVKQFICRHKEAPCTCIYAAGVRSFQIHSLRIQMNSDTMIEPNNYLNEMNKLK